MNEMSCLTGHTFIRAYIILAVSNPSILNLLLQAYTRLLWFTLLHRCFMRFILFLSSGYSPKFNVLLHRVKELHEPKMTTFYQCS